MNYQTVIYAKVDDLPDSAEPLTDADLNVLLCERTKATHHARTLDKLDEIIEAKRLALAAADPGDRADRLRSELALLTDGETNGH